MPDYLPITAAETDVDAPLTASLVQRLRDNPIAQAQQRPGAPTTRGALLYANDNAPVSATLWNTGGGTVAANAWRAFYRNASGYTGTLFAADFALYEVEVAVQASEDRDRDIFLRYGTTGGGPIANGYTSLRSQAGTDAINLELRTEGAVGEVYTATARAVFAFTQDTCRKSLSWQVADYDGEPRLITAGGYASSDSAIGGFELAAVGTNPPAVYVRVWGVR